MAMMDRRLEFHKILCDLLGSDHVYFQPPASVKMKYPAIRYTRDEIENDFGDNNVYKQSFFYQVTVISSDPDCEVVHKVSHLPMCVYDRHYVADNLNHDVFTICY